MTLRPRNKMRKLNESCEDITEEPQEDVTYNPEGAASGGASYLRFEIIEKKGL